MISLAPFGKNDFQQLKEWINDEALLITWSGSLFNFPLTDKSLDWYIRDTNEPGSSDAFVYKAMDEAGNTIGHISLGGISWKNRSARLTRVLLSPVDSRGKGYCHLMVTEILKIAFDELKLHRVGLGVYNDNYAAIKCYERAGFQQEGITRDSLWHNNNWRSMIEMSILEDEWCKQHSQ